MSSDDGLVMMPTGRIFRTPCPAGCNNPNCKAWFAPQTMDVYNSVAITNTSSVHGTRMNIMTAACYETFPEEHPKPLYLYPWSDENGDPIRLNKRSLAGVKHVGRRSGPRCRSRLRAVRNRGVASPLSIGFTPDDLNSPKSDLRRSKAYVDLPGEGHVDRWPEDQVSETQVPQTTKTQRHLPRHKFKDVILRVQRSARNAALTTSKHFANKAERHNAANQPLGDTASSHNGKAPIPLGPEDQHDLTSAKSEACKKQHVVRTPTIAHEGLDGPCQPVQQDSSEKSDNGVSTKETAVIKGVATEPRHVPHKMLDAFRKRFERELLGDRDIEGIDFTAPRRYAVKKSKLDHPTDDNGIRKDDDVEEHGSTRGDINQ